MANSVTNIIEIEYPENQKEAIIKIHVMIKSESFNELYEDSENTRTWWEENIGAKWVRLQDMDMDLPEDNKFMFNLESAWAEVGGLVGRINELTNSECVISHTFIDEMPNFAGIRVYEDGEISKEYVDWDMTETIENEACIREIAESRNFTNDSDRWEWMWDWKWDFVHQILENDIVDV